MTRRSPDEWPADDRLALLASRPGPFIVAGRAGMDLYPVPAGTALADASQFQADLGGSAGNIAVALARAGQPVQLLTALSTDGVGEFVRKRLAAYGVGDRYIARAGGLARNSLAMAETRPENCQVVIYRNLAADLQITQDTVRQIDFSAARALVITGTALSADPSAGACLAAAGLARQAACPVVVDLDYRAEAWQDRAAASRALGQLCQQADLITGNEDEFDLLAENNPATGQSGGLDLATDLARSGRISLYKMGAGGCRLLIGDTSQMLGIWPVGMAKPFGAGDAFLGNLLAGLAQGAGMIQAMKRGAAAAALVVSKPGCASAMPNPAELDDFVASHQYQPAK